MPGRLSRFAFLSVVCLLLLVTPAWASASGGEGSLWKEGTPSLFSDYKASRVGDLVTVLIVEHTYATNKAQTNSGKGTSVGVEQGEGLISFIPEIGFDSRTKFQGGRTTTRMGSFTAKMTARVVELLPNGNLRIQGTQGLIINNERQSIVITGTIRPRDITRDNTVLSTYVADAEIRYEGNMEFKNREGILGFLSRFFGGILEILF